MHNGHVRVNDEKMSKSLGNFFTVREILSRFRAEQVRYFLLASHYRGPLNYTVESLENAGGALERLYLALRGLDLSATADRQAEPIYYERFAEAMDDDFNTPLALSVLHELAREINRRRGDDPQAAERLGAVLRELGAILGLLQDDPEHYLRSSGGEGGLSDDEIEALLQRRQEARAARNFAEADRLRDELAAQGIIIEDSPQGTTWRRA